MIERAQERRAPQSKPLGTGALRCEACGTTWFEQLVEHIVGVGCHCRRCGGQLHTERRKRSGARSAAA